MAWPLLKRYGFSATVFLVTAHVGGIAEWDREYGEPAALMNWETMRQLAKEGVSFGSHGCSHRPTYVASLTELAKEAELSRQILMQELGTVPAGSLFSVYGLQPRRDRCIEDGWLRLCGRGPCSAGVRPEPLRVAAD